MGDILNFIFGPLQAVPAFWLIGLAVFVLLLPAAVVANHRSKQEYKRELEARRLRDDQAPQS